MPRAKLTVERMEKIVRYLTASEDSMSAAELADLVGIPANHVSALCAQLRDDKRIIRADGGGRRQRALWTVEKTNGEGQKETSEKSGDQEGAEDNSGGDSGSPRPNLKVVND